MATPMTADQLISQLKKWKIKYKETDGWRTRNRNHKGPFDKLNGFMWHHTGSDASVANQVNLLIKGYSELPGPLSQFGIAPDGVVWLIGWGRANHAGSGDDDVLQAVINEDAKFPVDNEANTDGNRHFYGAEFMYSGDHHMSDDAYDVGILLSCAIIDFHKWNENSILGHGQWQPGKWDPGYRRGEMMDMESVQMDIAARFKQGANYVPPSTPPVAEDSMVPATRSKTYNEVWKTDAMRRASTHPNTKNPYWAPETMLRYAAEQAASTNKKLDVIMKHLGIG